MAKSKKRLVILIVILVLVAGLLVLSEFLVTRQVEKTLKNVMKTQLKLKKDPVVKITSFPLLIKLPMGRVDRIELKAEDVDAGTQITISKLVMTITGLQVDVRAWITRKRLSVQNVDSVLATVVVSEKEVNRYLTQVLPGSKVKLLNGSIRYQGKVGFLAGGAEMDIRGRFLLGSTGLVTFIPVQEDIDKMSVSQETKQYLSDALTVDYAMPELPSGFKITTVQIKPGKMIVKGRMTEFDFVQEEQL